MHHKSDPVEISVEIKLRSTSPFKSDGPHHCRPILLIKRITSTNEEESPILLLCVLHPQETHRVNSLLYSRLHPPTQWLYPTILLRPLYRQLKNALGHHTLPGLSHTHMMHSGMLV